MQAEVLAKHGPQLTEAALEDMRYTEGVVSDWNQAGFRMAELLGLGAG